MLRKLVVLDAAEALTDLRVPPGNQLEKLKGARAGQHSIRINEQWRIARYFGTKDRFWLNLQARFDLELERDRLGTRLEKEVQVLDRAS